MSATGRKNMMDVDVYNECVERISRLTPESQPQWGTMSVGQMLSHCAEITEVMNGKALRKAPFPINLMGKLIKKVVMSDKPFSHGLRTHPQYKQTSQKDFATEKERLLAAISQFRTKYDGRTEDIPHPFFGNVDPESYGWGAYKHLDHHLQQFGV